MIFIVFGLAFIPAAIIYAAIASADRRRSCWDRFAEQYNIENPAPKKLSFRRGKAGELSASECKRLFAAWETELDHDRIKAIYEAYEVDQ
jgi:hypothetical protein